VAQPARARHPLPQATDHREGALARILGVLLLALLAPAWLQAAEAPAAVVDKLERDLGREAAALERQLLQREGAADEEGNRDQRDPGDLALEVVRHATAPGLGRAW